MKCLLPLLLSLAWICSAGAETPEKANPLIGKWRWGRGTSTVDFAKDGSVTTTISGNHKATWKETPSKTVERKYTISWDEGAIVDEVTIAKDGKKLRAENNKGEKFTAEKITP